MRFKRINNYLLLLCNYAFSSLTKRVYLHAKPIAASIEPANFCNLCCPQCPTGMGAIKKDKHLLSLADFKRMLDPLLPELMYLNLYFQGEPLINKALGEMVRYARKNKVYTVISTNAQLLDKPRVDELAQACPDKLIVCLDGYDEPSYSTYRQGGSFAKVIEALQLLKNTSINVEVQCLLLSTTENEQSRIKKMVNDLGFKKVVFKKAQFYSYELMPKNLKYTRYKKQNDGTYRVDWHLRNSCYRLFSSVVIDVDGRVLPCCYDKSGQYAFGNVLQQAFPDIWFGAKANAFRQMILKNRAGIAMCQNCTSKY